MSKKLETELAEIKTQQVLMAEKLAWMSLLLKVLGIEGPWVSPAIAGQATGRSRDRVLADIQTAEEWRTMRGKSWDMQYGVHYRNDQGINSSQPTWKVNIEKYAEFVAIPPDQLRA